jgi:hypothetical protein
VLRAAGGVTTRHAWLWLLVGLVLAALLLVARRMDAELVNRVADDYSWTSWSRRNRR